MCSASLSHPNILTVYAVITSLKDGTATGGQGRQTVDPGREPQWIQRGMAPLPLTAEQKADMVRLRTATVEFAHFSANASYIPPGYNIDDLLRLYMARAPPILV